MKQHLSLPQMEAFDTLLSEEMETRKHGSVRGHWRPAEDDMLKELVASHGPQNWNHIAKKLDGRSGKSCRLRWFNQLDPRINRKAFTEEEEKRLLSAHKFYGNKWAFISTLLPGRTDNAVKNQWHMIMARRQREHFDAFKRTKSSSSNISSNSSNVRTSSKNIHLSMFLNSYKFPGPSLLNGYDAKSEASAEGTVVNHEREKMNFRFIDFLGVGAT